MDVRAVREACAEALAGLGFTVYDVLPDEPQLPCAVVAWPEEIRFLQTYGTAAEADLTIHVAVPFNDTAAAQRQLDAAMAYEGVPAAVHSHQTDAWRAVRCDRADNVGTVSAGSSTALSFDFHLTVRS